MGRPAAASPTANGPRGLLGATCVDAEHRREAFSYVCGTPSASHTPKKDKWSWEKAPVRVPPTLPPNQVSSAAVSYPVTGGKCFRKKGELGTALSLGGRK